MRNLWAELEAWAQDELRSVNGQIEYLLRQAVQKRKGTQASRTEDASPASRGTASDLYETARVNDRIEYLRRQAIRTPQGSQSGTKAEPSSSE